MIYGAILAGGIGSRMQNTDMPKQFLELDNKPIIIHTLEKLLLCTRLDIIYIGITPDWLSFCEDLVTKHVGHDQRVRVIPGGKDRNGTITNIINAINSEFGIKDDDIIVTHDAVRPFVTERIIEENIDSALKYGACDTVIPATDTIVKSDDGSVIAEIPDRSRLYQGQTPQSFNIRLLQRCFAALTDDEKAVLTDACKICVLKDQPVHLVDGEVLNFKITTVGDYQLARAMLLMK
jgi:2-C-methyl-D-erythritol 4-phosphate cytidylyltransferase